MAHTHPEPGFPLLSAPYDVRLTIYKCLYPTKEVLQLAIMTTSCHSLNTTGETYRMTPEAAKLLLSCRQISSEITRMIYTTNKCVVLPGHLITHPWHCLPWHLRPSTMQMIKALHICLGWQIQLSDTITILNAITPFPRVIVSMRPLSPLLRTMTSAYSRIQQDQGRLCQQIAEARAGMEEGATMWDHCGSEDVKAMLDDFFPGGYCAVVWEIETPAGEAKHVGWPNKGGSEPPFTS